MDGPTLYKISCLCGTAAQTIARWPRDVEGPQDINMCHCEGCRRSTGLLCASYIAIEEPQSLEGLVSYEPSASGAPGHFQRFFCGKCGCQIFRRYIDHEDGEDGTTAEISPWAVASGIVLGEADLDQAKDLTSSMSGGTEDAVLARHVNTASTRDGGLSSCILEVNGRKLDIHQHWDPSPSSAEGHPTSPLSLPLDDGRPMKDGQAVLAAHCHCKTVRFHVTRPDAASRLPRSNFSDLIVPYNNPDPSRQEETSALVRNPRDDKWWLRPPEHARGGGGDVLAGHGRYLAGTCACRSCRLASGFEIQAWAFVPRANIHIHIHSQATGTAAAGDTAVPLDFSALPAAAAAAAVVPLRSYESSPGVLREFCPRCGATAFWHDRWRPDLVDVSAGLLDAPEGARAATWLDWWAGRVSFAEDATNGRSGGPARRARALIEALERGLRSAGADAAA